MEYSKKEIRIVLRCCAVIDLRDRAKVGQIYTEFIKRNCLRSDVGRRYIMKLRAVLTGTDTPTCFMCGELSRSSLCRECYDEMVTILKAGEPGPEQEAADVPESDELLWTAARPDKEEHEPLTWSGGDGSAAVRGSLWDEIMNGTD